MQQAPTAKNDTKLPRAVLQRSARIAQLEAERRAAQTEPSVQAAPPSGNSDAGLPKTPAQPTAPPADPRENDPAYWKQRFQTTAGTLATVKEDRATERRNWQTQFSELQLKIKQLEDQLAASAPPAEVDIADFFSPAEIEKYGEDQCRVMAATAMRATKASVKAAVAAEMQPLQARRTQEEASAAADRRQQFEEALTEHIPNWREIDAASNTPWHTWLLELNPDTGETNQELLTTYVQRGNVKGTASVFSRFRAAVAVPQPPITAPNAGQGDSPPPPPQVPSTATGGYPTQQEIRNHFKQAKLGKLKSSEIVAFEARLKLPRPQ
jgi:hypothetical protein